jgi:predicted ATPase
MKAVPSQLSNRLFPPFRFDPANQQLWRGKEALNLRRKTFEVLRYLVDHPNQLVTKVMLLDAVWPKLVVSDTLPATCVAELRKELGDDAQTPRFIETVHRRGYRFIGQIATAAPAREGPRKSLQVVPKRPKSLMVGREAELAHLQDLYAQMLEGWRLVLFVTGEAGIGKTTFVQGLLDALAHEGTARVGRGQCVEHYGPGEPYMPVLEALSRLSHEEGGEQVIELLNKFAPTWLAQMPELLTREERVRLQSEMQGVTQQRMLREMTQALEALAAETPLVLLLEDLHWSDFSTLELISAIARRREPARILIVGTYRPVEILANEHPLRTMKQELELHHYCEELRLKPLSGEDVEDYLAKRLAGDGLRQFRTLAPIIHGHTDGNPLFMANMVDYLLGDAGLRARSREVSEAELAETLRLHRLDALRNIRQMIDRNLERLSAEEQTVLEGASIVGADFSAAAVASALERPQHEIEACCMRLSRREQFISDQEAIAWPDGTRATGYRFLHALYQEVLYGRTPAGQRYQLHRRIAEREEGAWGPRAAEIAVELAYHYQRCGNQAKSMNYLELAGERAIGRRAFREAEQHYRDALFLVSTLPESPERDSREFNLQLALGGTLMATLGWSAPETAGVYARARTLAERPGDAESLELFHGLWYTALTRAELRKSQALADQALEIADRIGRSHNLATVHFEQGLSCFFLGNLVAARDHLRRALEYYNEEDFGTISDDPGVHSLAYTGLIEWLLGYPDRAMSSRNEADSLARRLNRPFALVSALSTAFFTDSLLRDFGRVLAASQELEKLATELGFSAHSSYGKIIPVWAHAQKGEVNGAVSGIREGLAELDTIEFHLWRGTFLDLLAETQALTGELDEALATAGIALETNPDERVFRPEILRVYGELQLKRGNGELAERGFREALELARSIGAKSWELRATTSLASLLDKQGKREEARRILAEIYNWFTEGFDTTDLKDAKALLDELG